MIHRTYVVYFPSTQRTQSDFVDICVRATMGTRLRPVADPVTYGAGNVTAPPAGWVAACGGTAYYELRGRTLSFEHLFGVGAAGGYTERAHLGFYLALTPYAASLHAGFAPASALLSQSLIFTLGGDAGTVIPAFNLTDPIYGVSQPVIRVYTPITGEGVRDTGLLLVHFGIAERKDEDFSPAGGP